MAYLGLFCVAILLAAWAEGTLAKDTIEDRVGRLEFNLARLQQNMDVTQKELGPVSRYQGCPPGFERFFEDSCYHLGDAVLSWPAAQEECQTMHKDAYLTEIQESKESEYMRSQTMNEGESRWIGLIDPTGDKHWIWDYSETVLGPYNDWAKGEPADDQSLKCAAISKQKNFHWKNLKCRNHNFYICETARWQ